MKKLLKLMIIAISSFAILTLFSCSDDSSQDPNVIGGDGNLPQNSVGAEYGASIKLEGANFSPNSRLKDSIKVIENKNGEITLKAKFTFNEDYYKDIVKFLGIESLNDDGKKSLLDFFKEKYKFSIDTTDKENMLIEGEIKGKMTSEGIQDYVYSNGDITKPFTIIKHNAKVGDKYEFTDKEGNKIIRTVVHKDVEDTFELIFFKIKVTKVEEVSENPLVSKIIYFTNHKFGLVNIQIDLKNGKTAKAKIIPWKNPDL